MTADRYEVWAGGRRQLSGFIQRRGAKMGLSTGGGMLFGSVFVALGTVFMLVGTHLLPVDPTTVLAPYWVITVAGASFVMAGLLIWGMAGKQWASDARRKQAVQEYPNEPALADYHWHPDGFEVSAWASAVQKAGAAAGITIFLSMFNWWAFCDNQDWMLKAIIGLFDCFGLLFWWQAGQQLGRALRFVSSRVLFTRFPYTVTEPVVLRWQPSRGINQVRKGTFTLRCVEEWMESSGSGEERTSNLVHEELWSGTWLLEKPRRFKPKEEVELRYDVPLEAQTTRLSADKPVFWELEAKLDLPGIDFKETYLIPIYAANASAPAMRPTKPSLDSAA